MFHNSRFQTEKTQKKTTNIDTNQLQPDTPHISPSTRPAGHPPPRPFRSPGISKRASSRTSGASDTISVRHVQKRVFNHGGYCMYADHTEVIGRRTSSRHPKHGGATIILDRSTEVRKAKQQPAAYPYPCHMQLREGDEETGIFYGQCRWEYLGCNNSQCIRKLV